MSNPFRAGDRVRHTLSGECGEFLGVERAGWATVRLDNMTPEQRMKLCHLEPEPRKEPAAMPHDFKVGDRVRFNATGQVGRVEIVPENPDYSYVIRLGDGLLSFARRDDLELARDEPRPEPEEDGPVAAIAGAAAVWQQRGQDREVVVHLRGHVVKVTAVVLQGEEPYLVKFLGPIAPQAVAEALDLACRSRCNLTLEVSPSGPDAYASEDNR